MLKEKYFLITVDTEGDRLWSWKEGDRITMENGKFIEPFQCLCEEFGLIPTYFVNYEAVSDGFLADKLNSFLDRDACEVGVHLHAWNTPPYYGLETLYEGQPYLIEYPESIMKDKFNTVYSLLKERLGIIPLSHRAGRWAMDERYFKILRSFGIIAECSHTPGVSWAGSCGKTIPGGSDYSAVKTSESMIEGVLEIPMTVRHIHHAFEGSLKHRVKTFIKGENVWLRPSVSSAAAMKMLIDVVRSEPDSDYVEFMIHSSELMPGGSIYFKTESDVKALYERMRNIFSYAVSVGYKACSVSDFAKLKKEDM